MSDNDQTKWIAVAAVLGTVAVAAVAVIVVQLLGRDGGATRAVDPPATTTSPTTPSSPSIAPSTTEPGGTTTTERADLLVDQIQIEVRGTDRTTLRIAPREAGASRLPVVVVLHGLGVNANAMSRAADWRDAVATEEFVAVFPQGVADSWNFGPCCPPASLANVPDLEFLDRLLDQLVADPSVDADRVYLTGFSNGGLMAYELACRRSSTFAAVAPMAASNLTRCAPTEPLSLFHQHADPDVVVPFGGGVGLGSLLSVQAFPPVRDTVAAWARANGCAPDPAVSADADVERFAWPDCPDGIEVELVRVPGRGHEWLDSGDFSSLDELLRVFNLS